jgi:hypothetical protein
MFVYECAPIDHFSGMTKLCDYMSLSYNNQDSCEYLTYLEIQKFLISSFMAVKCANTYWEGDIRNQDIYISAIPISGESALKILSFKQDNNGTSFIVSEFELPTSFDLKKSSLRQLNSELIMKYFDESFTLTIDLIQQFSKSYKNEQKPIVIDIDELKNALKKHDEKCCKEEPDKTSKENNLYDLSQFEKVN